MIGEREEKRGSLSPETIYIGVFGSSSLSLGVVLRILSQRANNTLCEGDHCMPRCLINPLYRKWHFLTLEMPDFAVLCMQPRSPVLSLLKSLLINLPESRVWGLHREVRREQFIDHMCSAVQTIISWAGVAARVRKSLTGCNRNHLQYHNRKLTQVLNSRLS